MLVLLMATGSCASVIALSPQHIFGLPWPDRLVLIDACSTYLLSCACRPVFNAVMKQTFADYQNITCLGARDDKNPACFNLSFRHVALAFQQYSKNKKLLRTMRRGNAD